MQCVNLVGSVVAWYVAQFVFFNAVRYQHILSGMNLKRVNVKETEEGRGKELITGWPNNWN
jgi:hypothetical protein